MFAYERRHDHALVLAAGIPAAWLQGQGIGIERLRTPFGELGYRLGEQGGALELHVDDGLIVPPGGLVFPWPYAGPPTGEAWLNGQPTSWHGNELVIHKLPATLRIERPTSRRSEEHTSELQSLMRISYAVFCLTKKNKN